MDRIAAALFGLAGLALALSAHDLAAKRETWDPILFYAAGIIAALWGLCILWTAPRRRRY